MSAMLTLCVPFSLNDSCRYGQEERLPKLAAELVALQVAAIVAGSLPAARAAKAATANIPIIFVTGADPQTEGLVSSISRPGGNMTGVSFYDIPLTGKRLALLRELVPKAEIIAILQGPNSSVFQTETREIEAAVRASGQKIIIVKAGSEQEINAAFSTVAQSGAGALIVGGGPFYNSRRNQLVGLAALHAIPGELCAQRVRRRRRTSQLWSKSDGRLPPCGDLCRPHSQGREAGRSSS
jgi:putative ABC transport system substrate-binding protein